MLIVYCTVSDEETAKDISRTLVSEGLCACINQIPKIRSYYIYEGEFCEDDELLLMIKTDEAHYDQLEMRIKELHPYDTPEIIATEMTKASSEYAAWLKSSLA